MWFTLLVFYWFQALNWGSKTSISDSSFQVNVKRHHTSSVFPFFFKQSLSSVMSVVNAFPYFFFLSKRTLWFTSSISICNENTKDIERAITVLLFSGVLTKGLGHFPALLNLLWDTQSGFIENSWDWWLIFNPHC